MSNTPKRPFPSLSPRASRWPRLSLLAGLLATATSGGLFAQQPVTALTHAPVPAHAASSAQLTLAAGTQEELVIHKGVDRIALANEQVASVLVTRKQRGAPGARLIITGKAPGSTSLLVWERGNDAATTYTVNVQRGTATLQGQFDSATEHQQARENALAARPDKAPLADHSQLNVKSQTVQVEVKIVEFNKRVLKQAGLNIFSTAPNKHGFSFGVFSPSTLNDFTFSSGGGLDTGSTSPLAQAFGLLLNFGKANIGLNLGLLEGNGLARVLAEPTLVALSGQSANFLAGGEIPVPVAQGLGSTTIEYKPFGIGLTVSPTVLSNQRIVLKVAPEASDLDFTNAVRLNGVAVPALTTRRADTTVELGDGESFVIGGLVSRTTTSSLDKVPMLGDLPVLGAMFKRQDYQQNERELVIVVTPHLVKPFSQTAQVNAALPGANAEQREPSFWRNYLVGNSADEALPGFSR
ncbi:type II and III secretion system protein family protein [Hydrogenophaga palleronii]|uniref:type II and III secretion system protein family protein n=1 Tax=Hydrogenophaga palleronii TaxID=65655 RepID=UPI0008246BC8|nr:type II and III secretion system protein family protein [Hydrogenophaga palleronii]